MDIVTTSALYGDQEILYSAKLGRLPVVCQRAVLNVQNAPYLEDHIVADLILASNAENAPFPLGHSAEAFFGRPRGCLPHPCHRDCDTLVCRIIRVGCDSRNSLIGFKFADRMEGVSTSWLANSNGYTNREGGSRICYCLLFSETCWIQ